MNQRIPNPDCRDGKHAVCDGHGWDIDADTAVRCPCACHTQEPYVQYSADPEPLARMAWEADLPEHHHHLVLDVHKGWLCACGHSEPLDYRGPVHAVPLVQGGRTDHMHYQDLPHKWGMQYTVRTADPSDTYCI